MQVASHWDPTGEAQLAQHKLVFHLWLSALIIIDIYAYTRRGPRNYLEKFSSVKVLSIIYFDFLYWWLFGRIGATDVAHSAFCVCLSVGHLGELCRSGWTDHDAVRRKTAVGQLSQHAWFLIIGQAKATRVAPLFKVTHEGAAPDGAESDVYEYFVCSWRNWAMTIYSRSLEPALNRETSVVSCNAAVAELCRWVSVALVSVALY